MATALAELDMNINKENVVLPKKKSGDKRLSVERIYQKKTQLEHIILRPDSYIGSAEPCQQSMWIYDTEINAIVNKNIQYTPGLYKIFDEIIVNAADNKQRDPRMNLIKVNIDQEKNIISVWNNGKGIPIEMHKTEQLFVPTLIFGHLLTSSNYDDSEKKVVGGRNGFGAKLCNIFSTKFTIETATGGRKFKQTWRNNMKTAEDHKITEGFTGTDYTCITFSPDLAKFGMEKLDDDFVALLKRRAYDMAGVCRGVNVKLNGDALKLKTFKDYVQLYLKGANLKKQDDPMYVEPKIIHEVVNPRWEVCCTVSDSGFQQASFVNSIATTKGGTHINYLVDQICDKLIAAVKKKTGKGGFQIKPFQVKSHLWIFANTLIENPTFDSQTKENMTLRKTAFGSSCELSPKYIKSVQDCGVLDNIMNWVKFKSEAQLNKKASSTKCSRLKGIPKLDDANMAGTKNSRDCTLIVTEGDSAKALAMAGLSVVGRDKYGVFPLRGKLLNVRDATHKQIMDNAEIGYLLKIIGLQFGKKYESEADMKSLRYGHLMIMADQDIDGSHIKGLVINFIHANWPSLLKLPFLEEFITPIVKVTKGKDSHSFFSLPEFEEWKDKASSHKSWRVKYYKGLGTSTSKEGKEYFANMLRHRIVFEYDGPSSDQALILAFSKKMINERKDWLTHGMAERKLRKESGLPEIYLYEKNTRAVTYRDFVNKELILFSNADNERSIPSLVDGFKPGQRKVMFTCFKRNDKHEVKVAQLAGSIAELSAYHHGEISLMGTVINLAQNFVGSNNLNLLQPCGQFGTRHMGGKDAASPRYICTMLSPLARLVFPVQDDHVLNFLYEDNLRIEPEWYCPIIPMCLVNGADGIGTGYATKIPNYDIRELVENVKKMIGGEEPEPMMPSFKSFIGDIAEVEAGKYGCYGSINIIDETTLEITELPVRTWTQQYKEQVLDIMLYGNEKTKPCITDYKEYHTDTSVKFLVSMTSEELAKAEQEGLHKKFKLDSSLHTTSMVLFDEFGCIRKYDNTTDIIKDFYKVRLAKYHARRTFLLGMLEAEASKLENQARFILEKIEGKIVIENRTKRDVVTTLVERGFKSDPVKTWKSSVDKDHTPDDDSEAPVTDVASSTSTASGAPDFSYLLSMAIMSMTKEKKEELLKQRDQKKEELESLRAKTPNNLWFDDLAVFLEELDRVEEEERLDAKASAAIQRKGGNMSAKSSRGKKVPVKAQSAKVEKKTKEQKKAVLKKVKDDFDFDDDSKIQIATIEEVTNQREESPEVEILSLADRLKKNISSGKQKQTTLSFQKKEDSDSLPTKSIPKNTKKKKASESSSDDDEIDDFSDEEIIPKRQTRTKAKKNYYTPDDDNQGDGQDSNVDNDDDDDSFHDNDDGSNGDSDIDDEFIAPKKSRSIPKNPVIIESDDESDNSEVAETRALIEKLTPTKKQQVQNDSSNNDKNKNKRGSTDVAVIGSGPISETSPPKKLKAKPGIAGNSTKSTSPPKKVKAKPAIASDSTANTSPPKKVKAKAAAKNEKSTKSSKIDAKEGVKQTKISFGKKKEPTKTTKASKSVAKRPLSISDSDGDGEQLKTKKTTTKTMPPKKPRKKIKKFDSDDDDDSFHVEEKDYKPPTTTSRAASGRAARTAAKMIYKFSSDEEGGGTDDDDFS